MSALEVRAMMPADLEAVAALARRADPFGWSLRNFQDALAAGYIMTLIEAEARIVGYFALMVVVDEAELLEIAVDPDFQGRGCGKTLLKAAVAAARAQACRCVHLEVRVSNERARKMYVSAGFCETGLRKNYYPTQNGREHAVLMRLDF